MLSSGKAESPPDRDPALEQLHVSPLLRKRLQGLGIFTLLLLVAFSIPLFQWAKLALNSQLFSYILLIPFISFYFVWINRKNLTILPTFDFRKALFPAIAGILLLGGYFLGIKLGWQPTVVAYVATMVLSFLLFFAAGCFAFLGSGLVRLFSFPLGFLIFMVPFPDFIRTGIETFLQHASAEAAYAMLKLSGMPVFRNDLVFQLPDFSMHVAPECSGIRSSLILFITSLIAAQLFLKRPLSKGILVFAVVVLGILRNGFRIFVLGQLCVRMGPHMIDSDLHHRGGPIFFALSLVPLFFLLWFLRKRERRISRPASANLS